MARLLVADDETEIREFLADALEMDGHDVVAVEDGSRAAALLVRGTFDVVVTDLRMPGQDGMSLLSRVRAEAPETQVIVLTAHASIESAVQAMRAGAYDYLEKPIASPAALRLLIARALERRQLLTEREGASRISSVLPPLSYGDPRMAAVQAGLLRVAKTDATVLLLGETGTGKEVAARSLHAYSPRAARPFIAVNCAALSESLLESELFGHEKGAFTGAHAQRRGRLELAEGGTFFLDEIGELKPGLQAKLLRVLQEGQFERVGGSRTLHARVRWVAATNRDLLAMTREGSFRDDLYHRLAVFPLRLPPLRERPLDLAPLTDQLLASISLELGRPGLHLADDARELLASAELRGNIRELRNLLERAAILSDQSVLRADHLTLEVGGNAWIDSVSSGVGEGTLEDIERAAIGRALQQTGRNRKRAAERLGIGLRTLYEKLKRYELE
jgi:two-component system response regulator AtoC